MPATLLALGTAAVLTGALVAPSVAAPASPRPYRIVLNPTADPATSQTVSWRTAARYGTQRVTYRIAAGGAEHQVRARRGPATTVRTSGSARPHYTATLTGLRPATTYAYRVVNARGRSAERRFTTAAATATPWSLIGLGDTQVDNRTKVRPIVARAFAAVPTARMVLQAGDVVNRPYRNVEWRDLLAAMGPQARTTNWAIAIGNHEQCILVKRCVSGDAAAFRAHFEFPDNGYPRQGETWYFTDYQGVRIVVLDSFGGALARQARFLDRALATNPGQWSIVLMHASPYASRPARDNKRWRAAFGPTIEKHDVDLVLAGHDHVYARGERTRNGPVYVTSVSGPKFYPQSSRDWKRGGARRVVGATQTATFQDIRFDGATLTYRAVVAAKGAASSTSRRVGEVLDTFTIVKRPDGTKTVS